MKKLIFVILIVLSFCGCNLQWKCDSVYKGKFIRMAVQRGGFGLAVIETDKGFYTIRGTRHTFEKGQDLYETVNCRFVEKE